MDAKSTHPPHADDSSLEVEASDPRETEARQGEFEQKARQTKTQLQRHQEQVDLMEKAMRETSLPAVGAHNINVRWGILRGVFYLALGYFLASAFFDFVNFVAGVKILAGAFLQFLASGAFCYAALHFQKRMLDGDTGRVWQISKKVTWVLALATLIYAVFAGLRGIANIAVYRTANGLQVNRGFAYFLCVLAIEIALCVWLTKQRKKARQALDKIEHEPVELDGPSRNQLQWIQYGCEGMILNLGFMALFHFTYNVDVPTAVFRALGKPIVLLFYFFPFCLYVFSRKFLDGLYSN